MAAQRIKYLDARPAQPSPGVPSAQPSPAQRSPGQLAPARARRSWSGPGRRSAYYVVRFLPLSPLEKNSWESFGRLEVWHRSPLVSLPLLALVRFLARVALWPPNAEKAFFLALCAPLYVSNIFLRDFLRKSIAPQPSAAARPPSAASCGGSSLPAFQGYRKSVFEWPRSG